VTATYVGHVWRVVDGTNELGHVAASAQPAVVEIR
jgi:hypothetical protein